MSDDRKDLPPVSSPNFLEKVREALGVYLGNRGDKLDRGITLRDLTDSGIVTLRPGFLSAGRGSPIGGVGLGVTDAYEPDLTPPPTPTGFVATAAISNLLVECAAQTYTQGHGHSKSVLYGASWISGPAKVFTDAVVLTEFGGTVASHATNPATTWHLWLKWVSVDGIASTIPAGGTNGVVTRTGEDVALLLTALSEKLTSSQLHSDLGARINLIDGAVGVVGSVNARLASESTARANADGSLFAQYTVKIDLNGHVSGFGLASTLRDAVPFSEFIIRADQFAIAPVTTDNAAADGSPFFHRTAATVIDGVTVPAGTYMKAAYIHDATITNAKIGKLAVDDAKIANLSATKLTAGTLDVGVHIQSTGLHTDGTPKWKIDGDGLATLNNAVVRGTVYATDGKFTGEVEALGAGGAGGDKARMYFGNFEVYRTVPGVGQVLYKALSRSESGVGANNARVTIPGYFRTQPKVIVSPASLQLYAAAYAGQNQSITVQADSILESSLGSMVWSFTPVATLNLAANTGLAVLNQGSGTQSAAWMSSQYTTPANTASISPSVTLASNRGNGASQYFYRTVRWKVQYFNGSSWVDGPYTTTNLAADTGASTVSTATFNFPGTGAWTFRIYCEAYDANGAVFGAASYNYGTDTVRRSDYKEVWTSGNQSLSLNYRVSYATPAGWEVTSYASSYVYGYNISATVFGLARVDGPNMNHTVNTYPGASAAQDNLTESAETNALDFTATSSPGGVNSLVSAKLWLRSATMTVQRRQLAANSAIAQNSFQFNSYGYTLTSAQVLATGSLNWVAIGD